MRLLLIDTCGAQGSIALADTALAEIDPIVTTAEIPGRSASERLVATIRDLLTQRDWLVGTLNAIAVVTGPGSFTGVRVGLAAAKGLAEALSIPIHPISRLATLAAAANRGEVANLGGATLCALLDAGRNEFYCGLYRNDDCLSELLLNFEEASAAIQSAAITIVCEAKVFDAFAQSSASAKIKFVEEPTASDALPFALRLSQQTGSNSVDLDANYLRKTDAEIFAKPTTSSAR